MGVQNLQFFMPNPAKTKGFTGASNVSGSQQPQKTTNFSDKLNSAVERTEKINNNGEATDLNAAKNLENQALENDADAVVQEEELDQGEVNAQAGDTQKGDTQTGNAQTEDPAENPASGAMPIVNAVPVVAANLLAQLESLQVQTNIANTLTETAVLYLAADKSKNILPEQKLAAPETGETMLAGNAAEEDNTDPQSLILTKAAKGQQLPQTILSKVIPHNVALPTETAPNNGAGEMLADGKGEQPQIKAAQLEMEIKGITEQLKGIAEQLQTQSQTTAKPAADLSGVKPIIAETVKLNEQPVASEVVNLKVEGETEAENLANQKQNTGGQFSAFAQKASAKATQLQNLDQPANNNQTFAVPVEGAAQNIANKTLNMADVASKAAPEFTSPRDDYQIKNQIVEQAALINRSAQESEMIIRLKPQHLGELALKVTVNSGVVNATFHTNNAEVRSVLENSLHQLKQDLANVGFKVDNVSISAGLSQFAASQEHAMQWQQQAQKTSGRRGGESYEETIDGITANQAVINSSTDDGVDYRI